MARRLVAGVACALMLAGCAQVPTDPDEKAEFEATNDPIEPFNRTVFDFNMVVDRNVAQPVARGYRDVVPQTVREHLHNLLDNLRAPYTFANDVLQGEPHRAADTLGRFMLNTTFGVLGLFDVTADSGGPKHHSEDFGQTLAVWGVPDGPYLMLPLLGPSNPRDAVGRGVGFVADPVSWALGYGGYEEATYAQTGMDLIDQRERLLDPMAELEKNSLDFYATIRSSYRQYRASEIANKDISAEQQMKSQGGF
jgi:phospholipid-binding lipoprotein MlaA